MPRLRNKLTGVVVDVDDATAARLGAMYEPIKAETESKPDPKPAPKRRAPARKKQ